MFEDQLTDPLSAGVPMTAPPSLPYLGPAMDGGRANSHIVEQQLRETVEEIQQDFIHKLRNETLQWDERQGKYLWVRPLTAKALVNDEGLALFLGYMSIVVNVNTLLSNWEPQEIGDTVIALNDHISDQIYLHHARFEVPKEARSLITLWVEIAAKNTFKRALRGHTANLIADQGIIKQQQTFQSVTPAQEAPSFWQRLNPMYHGSPRGPGGTF